MIMHKEPWDKFEPWLNLCVDFWKSKSTPLGCFQLNQKIRMIAGWNNGGFNGIYLIES